MPRPRELHDKFFKLAKQEGYAARSAYKLLEIQERQRVIKPGDWVLDLGCAPGSWLQVASELVNTFGRVVGIDLEAVTISLPEHVRTFVGDAFKVTPQRLVQQVNDDASAEPGRTAFRYHVVLSDMAPATTGTPMADHFRSVELCRRVLILAEDVLEPGGNLVMKVFEGEAYPDLLKECQATFRFAKGLRPEAVRDVSREIFIMCFGYKDVEPVILDETGAPKPKSKKKPRPIGDGPAKAKAKRKPKFKPRFANPTATPSKKTKRRPKGN